MVCLEQLSLNRKLGKDDTGFQSARQGQSEEKEVATIRL